MKQPIPADEHRTIGAAKQVVPDWNHETDLRSQGHTLVAGVDEAGRGAWAGPLVAGAVIMPHPDEIGRQVDAGLLNEIALLRDSKMLTSAVREQLLDVVRAIALATGVGIVSPRLIDLIGLGPANRLAMARAVRALGVWPDYLIIDAFKLPWMPLPQRPVIRGDATCMSIAAASIVAKVTRDRMMGQLDAEYPGYGFSKHKGYGTQVHLQALRDMGVGPLHRRSYAPIKAILAGDSWPPEGPAEAGVLDAE